METVEKIFDKLPLEAVRIRTEVFIDEQGFKEEFDDIDKTALHTVLYSDDIPIATSRIFYDEERKSYIIGRIAVIKPFRGQGIGRVILENAEKIVKDKKGTILSLHAQERASEFYRKQGYSETGEKDYDEYCPHVWMTKELD